MNALERAQARDREARVRLGLDETGVKIRPGRPVEVNWEKEVRDAITAYRRGLATNAKSLECIESPLLAV